MKYSWQVVPDGTKYTDGNCEGDIIDSNEWGDIQIIDGENRLVERTKISILMRITEAIKAKLPEPIKYAIFQWERSFLCLVGIYLILMINT